MKGYHDDIERQTVGNSDFRRVLYTGHHLQLVLMTLQPGEEIGSEVHEDRDQFFRFEEGEGKVDIDDHSHAVKDGSGVIVPAGARHNVRNTGGRRSSSTPSTARPSIRTASPSRPRPKPRPATMPRNGTAGRPNDQRPDDRLATSARCRRRCCWSAPMRPPADYAADARSIEALVNCNYAYLDRFPGGRMPMTAKLRAEAAGVAASAN